MCYSYVMGVSPSIEALKEEGFLVEKDGANYTVTFGEEFELLLSLNNFF